MFKEKGYKLIDLNLGYENLIVKSFNESIRVNNLLPKQDIFVSNKSINIYMESLAAIVHRDYITPIVEKETNLKLIPTYCYTRKYFQGSILQSHTDRPACEISATVHIGSDGTSWPIFMDDKPLHTKPGDAAVYLGAKVPHHRERFTGDWHAQIFLHYVS